ncbi:hypothetical protein HMPREF1624_07650 [Sporothrix schenckii ATCC 58251]|uniref:Uncharacterized protein n=1 Tax=Sporothrix schenckii (strain ATCC 58251 / de Perez 2211183) TaxID=1391915 RepID=U7PMZ3_SPOS1|nr:hypothetical protein HMPREF1624_07650 [Sporothrix schenckii ATCC 58251]
MQSVLHDSAPVCTWLKEDASGTADAIQEDITGEWLHDLPPSHHCATMCDFTKNYYIYTSCVDPGAHYFGTSVDGSRKHACSKGPHERKQETRHDQQEGNG